MGTAENIVNIGGDQEFLMTQKDFDEIAALAMTHTGIVLGNHKINMVYARIARRLRVLGMNTFRHYLTYLNANFEAESTEFVNALTTNLTSFFRENHHFDFLRSEAFPKLRQQGKKRLRIWSSGCSIGQEAYSIAITLKQSSFPSDWDIKILATDLDSNVVEKGNQGIYPADSISSLPKDVKQNYFKHSPDGKTIRVKDGVREMVYFKRLNLLEDWPVKGPFDIIFCRNVVIYFNKDTQRTLFDRYANLLPVVGYLFIGHSESLNGISTRFESIGNTIYRKIR